MQNALYNVLCFGVAARLAARAFALEEENPCCAKVFLVARTGIEFLPMLNVLFGSLKTLVYLPFLVGYGFGLPDLLPDCPPPVSAATLCCRALSCSSAMLL